MTQIKLEIPLSPSHYAYFELSRALLILEANELCRNEFIRFENLMMIDFGTQYPRIAKKIVPTLELILQANGLEKDDLSDIFSRDKIENHYERFSFIISCLVSRGLVQVKLPDENNHFTYFRISKLGLETTIKYSSRLSFTLKEISTELIESWAERNYSLVMKALFEEMPDSYSSRVSLTTPFKVWDKENE